MPSTSLEQALRRFRSTPLFSSKKAGQDLEATIEGLARERAKHPGMYLLSDLEIHITYLERFRETAEQCLATPDKLKNIAELVNTLYTEDADGILENSILQVEGETDVPHFSSPKSFEAFADQKRLDTPTRLEKLFEKEIEKDLKQYMPSFSMKKIRKLQKEVKILEAKRMGILGCAALLAENGRKEKRCADMIRRLARFWSGFKKTFAELLESDSYGDLAIALNEARKAKPRAGLPSLSILTSRVYFRYKNYAQGTKGRSQWKHKDTPHKSLDEENEGSFRYIKPEEYPQTDPDEDAVIQNLIEMIKGLPPAEQQAIEKARLKKTLTSAERKAKSRGMSKLKKILKK